MAGVQIQALEKRYGPVVRALKGIDLSIDSGAFFTLLGPSGCGKTTLLRCIAGFLSPDGGQIAIGGRRIDSVPAHRRDIGMVFQDYAVFPHLNVADNVGFGLRNRRVPAEEAKCRVAEALATVRLTGFETRMPQELSGGQQQRVGLARAMVIRPQLLLMDEPLSNLDAKLRVELREDIRDIQKKLGITTIYVTHDQEEALVISDRICVMNQGEIEQIGTPWEVYRNPARRFAAAFVGSMNFFPTRVENGLLHLLGATAPAPALAGAPRHVEVAIRPEDIAIPPPGASAAAALRVRTMVVKLSFMGREAQYAVRAPDGTTVLVHLANPEARLLAEPGTSIDIAVPLERVAYFDPKTGNRVAMAP